MKNKLASSLLNQSKVQYELYFYLLEMLLETNRDVYVPFKEGKMYFEIMEQMKGFTGAPVNENVYKKYIFHFDLIDRCNNDFDLTLDYKKMKIRDFIDKAVEESPSCQISFRGYDECCYNTDAIYDIWGYCYNSKIYNYHKHSKLVKEPI